MHAQMWKKSMPMYVYNNCLISEKHTQHLLCNVTTHAVILFHLRFMRKLLKPQNKPKTDKQPNKQTNKKQNIKHKKTINK